MKSPEGRTVFPENWSEWQCAYQMLEYASLYSGFRTSRIQWSGRERQMSMLRWAIMLNLRQMRAWSYPSIARFFEMDHTTILHGVGKCEEYMAKDEDYRAFVTGMGEAAGQWDK